METTKPTEHKEEAIVEECRRIRKQLDEEYTKFIDFSIYWEGPIAQ